jgi:hypothetical protein
LSVVEPIIIPKPEAELPRWAKVTPVSLVIEKKNLTFEEWQSLFEQLKSRDKKRQWIIGDALVQGREHFGEDAYQVIDPNEEAEQEEEGGETYRQYMQVADRIPPGSRLPVLSWGHHQAVAYLPPEMRDQWLTKAATEGLKRSDLRKVARKFFRQQEKKTRKLRIDTKPIHSEEAQAFFQAYMDALTEIEEAIPRGLPSARMMNHAHKGHALWQKNRTIETDCAAIVEMFSGSAGTEGVERASDGDIALWLQKNGYFMSDPDLEDRLEHMVEQKMLEVKSVEESRQDGRRGVMVDLYALHAAYEAKLDQERDPVA